ncbi:MAG TPA: transposase [Deltaproteobacteria bacterium]|jgi:REP element-mobilizing transposase RayT|nr:transposase [Deltaproteobacteria bacterium]
MPQSLAQVHIHVIFSTKNRMPFLVDAEFRKEMHAYLATIMKAYESPAQIVGGTADHVHILCGLSRSATVAKLIGEAKRSSSKWIKTKGGDLELFQWQNGYGVFSVSYSKITEVREYISNQMNHHKKMSFQEEYRLFLRKHSLDFDEAHVWD